VGNDENAKTKNKKLLYLKNISNDEVTTA